MMPQISRILQQTVAFSYNHSIWTNDERSAKRIQINRIVSHLEIAFLTLGTYSTVLTVGVSQMPTRGFLGHFSNGLVWTEYLAKEKNDTSYTTGQLVEQQAQISMSR